MKQREILNLGKVLRQQRKERNLTLKQVAIDAGISAGLLSLIENGNSNPSIGTLFKIADVLGSPMSSFFTNLYSDEEFHILKKNERKKLKSKRKCELYSYEYLAHNKLANSFQPFLVTFDRDQKAKRPEFYAHRGEEFLYVIEGEVEFLTEEKKIILKPGDSIHFKASIPHTFRRKGFSDSTCITIVCNRSTDGEGGLTQKDLYFERG